MVSLHHLKLTFAEPLFISTKLIVLCFSQYLIDSLKSKTAFDVFYSDLVIVFAFNDWNLFAKKPNCVTIQFLY